MEKVNINNETSFKLPQNVLTKSQIDFYDQNGYLVVEDVFSSELCDQSLATFEKYAESDYSSIMNLDRTESKIRNLMRFPRIVDILETLQRSEVYGCQTFFLFKRVGSPYAAQAWNPHQDNSYPQAKPGGYITANIPFADQDKENGGMYIYPGSHKEGLLPFSPQTGHKEEKGVAPGNNVIVPDKYAHLKTDLVMKKGSCLFLNGNVLHGSYPNTSKTRSRPMLLMTYIKKGEPFIPGIKAQRGMFPLR